MYVGSFSVVDFEFDVFNCNFSYGLSSLSLNDFGEVLLHELDVVLLTLFWSVSIQGFHFGLVRLTLAPFHVFLLNFLFRQVGHCIFYMTYLNNKTSLNVLLLVYFKYLHILQRLIISNWSIQLLEVYWSSIHNFHS